MKFEYLVVLLLICISSTQCREYHYNRPQTPFTSSAIPIQNFQVHTNNQRYEVQSTHHAATASVTNHYQAQHGQHQHSQPVQNFIAYVQPQSGGYTGAQSAQYTPRTNPLLQPQPAQYGATHTQTANGHTQSISSYSQSNPAHASVAAYTPPQSGSASLSLPISPPGADTNHGQNYQQTAFTQAQSTAFSSNIFQGGAAGGVNSAFGVNGAAGAAGFSNAALGSNANVIAAPVPDSSPYYVAQTENGQLDGYAYKQRTPSDTRKYSRTITNCYLDGHCDPPVTIGSGLADARHENIVISSRGRLQPSPDKCRQLASDSYKNVPQELLDPTGQEGRVHQGPYAESREVNRPHSRRLYPYAETPFKDPYN